MICQCTDEILFSDISPTLWQYFKNADSLVENYPNYFCLKHDTLKQFEIKNGPKPPTIKGSGVLQRDKWNYEFYIPIFWDWKCECGYESDVGFQFRGLTSEWEEAKQKLISESLSEENMKGRQLAKYSHYKFFDGRFLATQKR